MFINKSIISTLVFASVALANNFTNSDWTTLAASGAPSGAITSYSGSFAIAVVPVTTGTYTSRATAGAAQLEALSVGAKNSGSGIAPQPSATASAAASDDSLDSALDAQKRNLFQRRHVVKREIITLARRDDDDDDSFATASAVESDIASPSAAESDIASPSASASASEPATDAVNNVSSAEASSVPSDISQNNVSADNNDPITSVSCAKEGTLTITLKNGILEDSKGRIGAIVSNRQFQFDGPPQSGTIYAKGWSITSDGYLAIGNTEVFYRCLSGSFYNLYDQNVAYQCSPIKLLATGFKDC